MVDMLRFLKKALSEAEAGPEVGQSATPITYNWFWLVVLNMFFSQQLWDGWLIDVWDGWLIDVD